MINSENLNNFVLKPLMMRNKNNLFENDQTRIISEAVTNNVTVRKIKKFDLAEYLKTCLIPQNSVKETDSFSDIFSGINSGNCALFVDTLTIAFDIEVKGFGQRSVEKPNNEIVIDGPHEAFVENIRTNTSLLRRIINNEHLIIENIEVGEITKTKCALCYIKDIANTDLISEVRYRLNNLAIDYLTSSGQLEQLIQDNDNTSLPQIIATERPDRTSNLLFEGRIAIIVNGSPYVLIVPAIFSDFLASSEDYNLKYQYSNFVRALRIIALAFALLLPSMYMAITSFHQELVPTELLYSIISARETVPFPILFEILIMELSFELIRDASIRVPSPVGQTIGIVGALILGQAAVDAGIVSPILIIIVSFTAICSFSIPDFSLSFHFRIMRFIYILLGAMAGFLGLAAGLCVHLLVLNNMHSFGVSYLGKNIFKTDEFGNGIVLSPAYHREKRSKELKTKRPKSQDKISMRWKYPQH